VLEREVEGADLLASSLVLVEVPRAVGRLGLDPQGPDVVSLLDELRLLTVEDDLLQAAALLRPPALRSLDAVHLASALSVRDRLDALVAYDARLVDAARAHGLPVLTPGADR
jgi:predicted nucleic acid-binding protein